MNREESIRAGVLEALGEIAPEADLGHIRPAESLREQLDIDSMDFLNFAIALHRRLGVAIPEADYGKIATLDAVVRYLAARLPALEVGHA